MQREGKYAVLSEVTNYSPPLRTKLDDNPFQYPYRVLVTGFGSSTKQTRSESHYYNDTCSKQLLSLLSIDFSPMIS